MAHILLGVTGSIAAFKACHLASDWSKQGHEVRVVMTAAAQEFVTPLTFNSLTHTPTRTSMFAAGHRPGATADVAPGPDGPLQISHVADAKWANLLAVAPASADIIAKIACGIADDQLTSTILAYDKGPKILCPAMNVHMYENAVTQRNLNTCRELGWTIVEPESGMLACGDAGKGRMEEPARIETAVEALLLANRPESELPLKGLAVLVTAGPTQEPLDPVRFLTNHSTGKMGYALAEQARDLGAQVTLVSGPVALDAPYGVDVVDVTTARDMFDVVTSRFLGHGHHRHGRGRRRFPYGRAGPGQDQEERAQRHRARAHVNRIFWLGPASISGRTRHCADSPWRRATLRPTRRRSLTASIATCWWPTICAPPAPFRDGHETW